MSSISFFLTGHTAQNALMEDIRKAKVSVEVEMFIIATDETGKGLLSLLMEKAKEGVKVRVLADAVGSFGLYRSSALQKELDLAGVEYSFFNHLVPWYPKKLSLWYFRNHRRAITIDEKICYAGSFSFANHMCEWRETVARSEWRDTVIDMKSAFERMWKLSKHNILGSRITQDEIDSGYITHGPFSGHRHLYWRVIKLIREAKEEILITTPYFIPDHRMHRALQHARKKGVHIVVIVPRPSNHPYVDWAGDYDKTVYLRMGAELYFYTGMIHAKTMVVDEKTAIVGSMNFDNISLRYNFESALILTEASAVHELRQHFMEDMALSHEIPLSAWEKRPLREKILMWMMWPFRKLL